ncbi:hypothetical protein EJ07DRAFT_97538 [Lizonia empirigonia]|nr:hypothetical protein EJ07DRAFT_97538 [Lizonia empirigonia]
MKATPRIDKDHKQLNDCSFSLKMSDQATLAWKYDSWGTLHPVWVKEPVDTDIEQVARRELKIPDEMPCVVNFLAEGSFNKVYTLQCNSGTTYIIRLTLPIQPYFKMLSEVATMEYVQRHTNIPTPLVLASESSHANKLGFEWVIMTRVSGTNLDKQWKLMSWLKKELLVRRIVSSIAQLFQKRFDHIGNLYRTYLQKLPSADILDTVSLDHEHSSSKDEFCLGKVVSLWFIWGNHLKFDVPRSPFKSSQEWLRTTLRLFYLAVDDPVTVIKDSDDGTDSDEAVHPPRTPDAIKVRIQRPINLLPTIFSTFEPEAYVLHHGDLHEDNILIGDDLELAGIIDWECLPIVPLWTACEIPEILDLLDRHEYPDPDTYGKDILEDGSEQPNFMYDEHMEEHEKTQLRTFFLEEMQRTCPEWVEVYRQSKLKAAFGGVVVALNDLTNSRIIDEWLDEVEEHGTAPSFGEMYRDFEQRFWDHQLKA